MNVQGVELDAPWLTDQGEAHLVVAQSPPAAGTIMVGDGSRPWIVQTIRSLLGAEQRRLAQIVTGSRPSILVLPELALGSDDWTTVDELVRAWPHPLILLAGFGFTSGAKLKAWAAGIGPTVRHDGSSDCADERVYNGGWCWVHLGNETRCVSFLKTTAEQHHEVHVEGLDQGTTLVSIRLKDLIIFPVICSDLLSVVDGQRVVQRHIARYIEDHVPAGMKILLVGLLLQKAANEKWRTAVLDVARNINSDRVNVCLVNNAHDIISLNEEIDRWRSYSGIYIAKGRDAYLDHFAAVRRFASEELDAAVVRATSAAVLGGPVRWDFAGATGRHLWVVNKDYGIAPDGTLTDTPCSDRFLFEFRRVVRRFGYAVDAPPLWSGSIARANYDAVVADVVAGIAPNAESICQKLLFGEIDSEAKSRLSSDTLSSFLAPMAQGLRAIGALKALPTVSWVNEDAKKGQLAMPAQDMSVLVWCSPDTPIRVRQTLQRWRSTNTLGGSLLAFTKAVGASFGQANKISDRRGDIGSPPPPPRRSVDEPRYRARVAERQLDDIEQCYANEDSAVFSAAVQQQLDLGLAAVNALGDQHA